MTNPASVGEMFNRTEELISWLVNKGITTANSSRVSEYEKIAKYFWEATDITNPDIAKIFENASDSIFEFLDLLEIKDVFGDEESSAFLERLEKAHKGKPFVTCPQEGESRNFLFELLMAAFFFKKGYTIPFDSPADIVILKPGITGYIECKKCYSIKKIDKKLKKAHRQLVRYDTKSNTDKVGIVAIDISYLISKHMPKKEFKDHPSANEAIDKAFKCVEEHISKYVFDCNDEFVDTTLATIVHFSTSYWLENVSGFLVKHNEVTTSNFIGDTSTF